MHYEKNITFPVFGYIVHCIYTDDINSSREKHTDILGACEEILSPSVDGMHDSNKLYADGYIFFTPDSTIGTIAHECFHALWRMFKFYGAKLENETFA